MLGGRGVCAGSYARYADVVVEALGLEAVVKARATQTFVYTGVRHHLWEQCGVGWAPRRPGVTPAHHHLPAKGGGGR